MSSPPSTIASQIPKDLQRSKPHAFNSSTDIPSQAGKVILITGATSGIGKQTALEFAKHSPSQLWITGRNVANRAQVVTELKSVVSGETSVKFVELDLTSFDSIKAAARTILSSAPRLDILMLNAGIMGGPPSLTPSSYEVTFGTNHVGHALLLKLLFPLLLSTPSPRVIFTSSRGHKHVLPAGGIAFDSLKTARKDIKAISKYTSSKLANVVYARQVAKRYPQIICVAIHPEDVATQLFSKGAVGGGPEIEYLAREVTPKVGVSVEEGAKNGLWAATAEGVESGRYYEPVGVLGMGSELSRDEGLGIRLWEWTERELEGVEV